MEGHELILDTSTGNLPAAQSAALVNIEKSRAIAEAQAAMIVAQGNPRDENRARQRILQACKRTALAKTAEYRFKRGKSEVTGPSIRMAEVMARHWGNTTYGFREIGRDKESSEVEAFCHDLETNTRVVRQFQVKHWRDTQSGGYAIKEERDKYELIANMAQRRVRACILEIIPGDIAEEAVDACKATLAGEIKDPVAKGKEIVRAFDALGVTLEDIERYLNRPVTTIVPVDVINLQGVYNSIKAGISAKEEHFRPEPEKTVSFKPDEIPPKSSPPPPVENIRTSHPNDPTVQGDLFPPSPSPSQADPNPPAETPQQKKDRYARIVKKHKVAINNIIGNEEMGDNAGVLDALQVYKQTDIEQEDGLNNKNFNDLEKYIDSLIEDYTEKVKAEQG